MINLSIYIILTVLILDVPSLSITKTKATSVQKQRFQRGRDTLLSFVPSKLNF